MPLHDLDGVLVGAHGAIRAQAIKQRADGPRIFGRECSIVIQAGVRDVVANADGEMILRLRLLQFIEDGLDHRRCKFLGREPVTPANDPRHGPRTVCGLALHKGGNNVLIQRYANAARLLGAVEDGDATEIGRAHV